MGSRRSKGDRHGSSLLENPYIPYQCMDSYLSSTGLGSASMSNLTYGRRHVSKHVMNPKGTPRFKEVTYLSPPSSNMPIQRKNPNESCYQWFLREMSFVVITWNQFLFIMLWNSSKWQQCILQRQKMKEIENGIDSG
ncbi:hypothetical protein CKAN_02697000 [Cinnamomum micranthum f. kanehirae]|uniref:Uncharacterized protein n=1 Tax=Cinnamomum micranthum f. kanehirae TaxID=337451 RepID=A0A3S3N7X3_9MAGN|nr:hypothetical protein CKAN_02697000 [Cinnamomum micranthum f. kanehirae]